MHKTLPLLLAFLSAFTLSAVAPKDDRPVHTFSDQGFQRTYTIHLPPSFDASTPVIVYAHGYNSKRRWLPALNAAADSASMAVVYPDGLPDAKGKDGWVVGYPGQEVIRVDECAFFSALLDDVASRFGLSRTDVFLAGMSNGGDLCYRFMYSCPQLFKAYASVAGLTFENFYLPNSLTAAVPFMEIHGDADTTSSYCGDHDNHGGWGAYIPVPLAVGAIAASNRCCAIDIDSFPSLADSTRTITHRVYSASPSGSTVELYTIGGGKHSWGEKDLPTSRIVVGFFDRFRSR